MNVSDTPERTKTTDVSGKEAFFKTSTVMRTLRQCDGHAGIASKNSNVTA